MEEDSMPRPGEIWYSRLVGHKVRIVAVERSCRRVIVTDGTRNYSMFFSHFLDAGNGWACIRKSASSGTIAEDPRPRPPVRLRPKRRKPRRPKPADSPEAK